MKNGMLAAIIVFCLIFVGVGAWFQFLRTAGYKETTAVITKIEEDHYTAANGDRKIERRTYIEYEVDGKKYAGPSDVWQSGYYEGKQIKIYYDPSNPARMGGEPGPIGWIFMGTGLGIILLAVVCKVFFKPSPN